MTGKILASHAELLPQYQGMEFTRGQPAFFGEIALMLWLVFKGARPPEGTAGEA